MQKIEIGIHDRWFWQQGHFIGKQQKNGNEGHFKINFYAKNRSEWRACMKNRISYFFDYFFDNQV
jgi:hypothetical protein